MEHVAEDVVVMPLGEGAMRGKTAMHEWHGTFLSLYPSNSLKLDNRGISVGNSLAVEIGTDAWGLQPVAGGETFIDYGNYMNSARPPTGPSTRPTIRNAASSVG